MKYEFSPGIEDIRWALKDNLQTWEKNESLEEYAKSLKSWDLLADFVDEVGFAFPFFLASKKIIDEWKWVVGFLNYARFIRDNREEEGKFVYQCLPKGFIAIGMFDFVTYGDFIGRDKEKLKKAFTQIMKKKWFYDGEILGDYGYWIEYLVIEKKQLKEFQND